MSRKPPRKFRRPLGRRKSHVSNPRSRMARSRKNTLWKGLGLDDLVATSSLSPSPRRASKYSKYAAVPSSAEPLEENCAEGDPLPPGYVFVPKGDVYITRRCRSKTRESQRIVYAVYDIAGKRTIGLRVPSDIYAEVLHSAAVTADVRANAVKLRDEKDRSRSCQQLQSQFPLMPSESREMVLHHAFLKGSGRVGRTSMKTEERKAVLAVEAHIRHLHTPYEALLDAGMTREQARDAVLGTVQTIKAAWEGGGTRAIPLTLRTTQ
ncbi:Uncharacterized conserved protein DUF2293 [Aspergillus sp. HF37]|nr:Uncharacterized conserved protein DUF2293 [Aspergillus sp. HF37]